MRSAPSSSEVEGRFVVPRVIHRVWLGGPEPEWTRPFAESWERPGWELRQWGEDDLASLFPLVNQDIFDRAAQIAPDHVGQLRSDVLRYELLWRFGGVWIDTDFECLRPIDPLLEGVECFAAWEITGRWVNNAILGAPAGHPFIARLIDGLAANVEANRGRKPNRMSGPQYLTRMLRRYHPQALRFGDPAVTVFPRELFYPFSWRDIERFQPGECDPASEFPEAVACHWWQNKRRERALL